MTIGRINQGNYFDARARYAPCIDGTFCLRWEEKEREKEAFCTSTVLVCILDTPSCDCRIIVV